MHHVHQSHRINISFNSSLCNSLSRSISRDLFISLILSCIKNTEFFIAFEAVTVVGTQFWPLIHPTPSEIKRFFPYLLLFLLCSIEIALTRDAYEGDTFASKIFEYLVVSFWVAVDQKSFQLPNMTRSLLSFHCTCRFWCFQAAKRFGHWYNLNLSKRGAKWIVSQNAVKPFRRKMNTWLGRLDYRISRK